MRVRVTGVSGVGKSSLVGELRRRGFDAVDAVDADDDGFTSPRPDGTWGWRRDQVRAFFEERQGQLLFFAGCSNEQAEFDFDMKVLLTAPVDVIVERLQTRTNNSFGRTETEHDRVLSDAQWLLPLLRASADLVIETTTPISDVADGLVEAVALRGHEPTSERDH